MNTALFFKKICMFTIRGQLSQYFVLSRMAIPRVSKERCLLSMDRLNKPFSVGKVRLLDNDVVREKYKQIVQTR